MQITAYKSNAEHFEFKDLNATIYWGNLQNSPSSCKNVFASVHSLYRDYGE